jgi:hypothetical protein
MIMHLPRCRTSPERHGDLSRSMSSSSKAVAGAWPPAAPWNGSADASRPPRRTATREHRLCWQLVFESVHQNPAWRVQFISGLHTVHNVGKRVWES